MSCSSFPVQNKRRLASPVNRCESGTYCGFDNMRRNPQAVPTYAGNALPNISDRILKRQPTLNANHRSHIATPKLKLPRQTSAKRRRAGASDPFVGTPLRASDLRYDTMLRCSGYHYDAGNYQQRTEHLGQRNRFVQEYVRQDDRRDRTNGCNQCCATGAYSPDPF
jgi:hypothetical protein